MSNGGLQEGGSKSVSATASPFTLALVAKTECPDQDEDQSA
jgi:hypothetical protein